MKRTRFGILGAGWRAEFYLRVASALPDRFVCGGIYVRNPDTAARLRATGAPVMTEYESFCAGGYDFVVCCVRSGEILSAARDLVARGYAVLCETPAGRTLEQLHAERDLIPATARVQVAEQYLYQPEFAAARALSESGLLGPVHYVRISAAHEYHGVSLVRGLLGVGTAFPDRILGMEIDDPVRRVLGRPGRLPGSDVVSKQTIGILRFGQKSALLDFTGEQYFSPIRSGSLLMRGPRGEYSDGKLCYLDAQDEPVRLTRTRVEFGRGTDLGGYALDRICFGPHVLYRNPYPQARLSDEELAVAGMLEGMQTYLATGRSFYSLAEERLDCEIAYRIREVASGA